jgi:hypothetical protein
VSEEGCRAMERKIDDVTNVSCARFPYDDRGRPSASGGPPIACAAEPDEVPFWTQVSFSTRYPFERRFPFQRGRGGAVSFRSRGRVGSRLHGEGWRWPENFVTPKSVHVLFFLVVGDHIKVSLPY